MTMPRFHTHHVHPGEQDDYKLACPLYPPSEIEAKKQEARDRVLACGGTPKHVNVLEPHLEQWAEANVAAYDYATQHPDGLLAELFAVHEKQSAFMKALMKKGKSLSINLSVALDDCWDIPGIWNYFHKRMIKLHMKAITAKPHAILCAKAAKIILMLFQACMILSAFNRKPLENPLDFLMALGIAFLLSIGFQVLAHGVVDTWADIHDNLPVGGLPVRTKRHSQWIQFAWAFVGFCTLVPAGVWLDAHEIVRLTMVNAYGELASTAIPFPVALPISLIFSGMMAWLSIEIARHGRAPEGIERRIGERIADIQSQLSALEAEAKLAAENYKVLDAREREVFARALGEWTRIRTAEFGILVGATAESIGEFLNSTCASSLKKGKC